MDRTKRFFVFFRQAIKHIPRYFAVQRPNALEYSLLAKLPAELLQQIADDLPPASAASFSLSCRQIHFSIGNRYLHDLASSSDETLVFLDLIEHDLQDQIVCSSCRKLHKIKYAKKYTQKCFLYDPVVIPNCLFDDMRKMIPIHIDENFSTIVFKMVMKHYRLFGDDIQVRRLCGLLTDGFRMSPWGGTLIKKRQSECRIRNGSLFICKRIAFHGNCADVKPHSIWFYICPHLEVESVERPASLRIMSHSVSNEGWLIVLHRENGTKIKKTSWDLGSEVQQCRYCRTEYKAEFEHGNECTMKSTFTIWKDLGHGPETEEWKAQMPSDDSLSVPERIQFHRGEIASFFQ
ncbi:hypothetical protein BKA64DRAFT_716003 [Cadophora sp. MPI-SDFR-AT-0126]|nr:hypothetical protein BKA64DRAFT_716003 [Leotiomycetes sp. MPI-SDFR-AT-0126]